MGLWRRVSCLRFGICLVDDDVLQAERIGQRLCAADDKLTEGGDEDGCVFDRIYIRERSASLVLEWGYWALIHH